MSSQGYTIPHGDLRGRLPHRSNWPGVPAKREAGSTAGSVMTRQRARRESIQNATAAITKRFGGERRRIRRAIGRDLAKRELRVQRAEIRAQQEAACRTSE